MQIRTVCLVASVVVLLLSPCEIAAQSTGSLKALETAAAKGNLAAMYALGAAAEADGDIDKALTHFRAAAEAGYAGAQFKLGEFYEHGRGVPVDAGAAARWYEKAAEQGLAPAIESLKRFENANAASAEEPAANAIASPATDAARSDQPAPEPSRSSPLATSPNPLPTPAASQQATPTANEPSSVVSSESSSFELVLMLTPMVVGLLVGAMVWKRVRGVVLRWYQSRQFFVTGRTAVEMMTKEVGLRLQVEWVPLIAGFATFVGITVGGWKLFEVLFGFRM